MLVSVGRTNQLKALPQSHARDSREWLEWSLLAYPSSEVAARATIKSASACLLEISAPILPAIRDAYASIESREHGSIVPPSAPELDRGVFRSSEASQQGPGRTRRTYDADHVGAEAFGGVSRSVSRLSDTRPAANFTEYRARWA